MYDTVHSWLPTDSLSYSYTPFELSSKLTSVSAEGIDNLHGRKYIKGHLRNIRVYADDRGVGMQGSLPKYFLGDSLQTMTRHDTHDAIEMLSDALSLPIYNANATRIDIAENVSVSMPVMNYYPLMGDAPYMTRFITGSSLYYSNGQRQTNFYDKVAEGLKNKQAIPQHWTSPVLRYEHRLKSPKRQLKVNQFLMSRLYAEDTYISAVEAWHDAYKSITKLPHIKLNYDAMNTPKDFQDQITALAIQKIGYNQVIDLIETMRRAKVFDKPEYYSRIKRKVKDFANLDICAESVEAIEELDKKIENVVRYYR